MHRWIGVVGYMVCGIPLVRSANGNGNGIPFLFVSVKKVFESSVSVRFRSFPLQRISKVPFIFRFR